MIKKPLKYFWMPISDLELRAYREREGYTLVQRVNGKWYVRIYKYKGEYPARRLIWNPYP